MIALQQRCWLSQDHSCKSIVLFILFSFPLFLLAQPPTVSAPVGGKEPKCGESYRGPDGGEIIIVCDPGCDNNSVILDGICVPKWVLGSICDLAPERCGINPEDNPPDRNPPNPPKPEKPTEAACNAAFESCEKYSVKRQESCIMEWMLHASLVTSKGMTCFAGNERELIESITLRNDPNLLGQVNEVKCKWENLNGRDLVSRACQLGFRTRAMQQCSDGFKGGAVSASGTITSGMSLEKFIELGVSETITIQINMPPGSGYRTGCAELGARIFGECQKAREECLLKAKQVAAMVAIVRVDTAQIIAQIDQVKLGMRSSGPIFQEHAVANTGDKFIGVGRGSMETSGLYLKRITFLAAWSKFLAEENISKDVQNKIQAQLANVQAAYKSAYDDLIAYCILAFRVNPETKKPGTIIDQNKLRVFLSSNQIGKRIKVGEATLFSKVKQLLGTEKLNRFKRKVWPGVSIFGSFSPFYPKQAAAFS